MQKGLKLLGLGKEPGLSKCARVDSVGLAKRRLAKVAHEELVIEEPDSEETTPGPVEGNALLQTQEAADDVDKDDTDTIFMALVNRQPRDSLRMHRRRFRHRASLELPNSRLRAEGTSWSSGSAHRAPGEQDQEEDGVEAASSSASRHVRFRRASDGEYLGRETSKQLEASGQFANPLKMVQLKAERLFRRLQTTLTFSENPQRPRSSNPSRSGSPTRNHPRTSNSRTSSTTRTSSAGLGLGLRQRSVDARVDSTEVPGSTSPTAVTAADGPADSRAASATSRRAKRKSAPGELFFPVVAAAGDGNRSSHGSAAVSPGRSLVRPVSGTFRDSGNGSNPIGKGRNWLAKISRGITGAATGAPTGAAAPVVAVAGGRAGPVGSPTIATAAAASPPPSPHEALRSSPPASPPAGRCPSPTAVPAVGGDGKTAEGREGDESVVGKAAAVAAEGTGSAAAGAAGAAVAGTAEAAQEGFIPTDLPRHHTPAMVIAK